MEIDLATLKAFLDRNPDQFSYEIKGSRFSVVFRSNMQGAIDRLGASGLVKLGGRIVKGNIYFDYYRQEGDDGEHDLPLSMLKEWLNYIMMAT